MVNTLKILSCCWSYIIWVKWFAGQTYSREQK